MKKISLLLAFLGFIGLQVVFAQTRDLSGAVTSSEDGSPIPGASVVAKGTTMGTVTDTDGKFTLKVPVSAKALMVSFVGMVSAEVPITGSTNYAIKLKSENISVDEVVVIGYGTTTKQSFVGSIKTIKTENNTCFSFIAGGFIFYLYPNKFQIPSCHKDYFLTKKWNFENSNVSKR